MSIYESILLIVTAYYLIIAAALFIGLMNDTDIRDLKNKHEKHAILALCALVCIFWIPSILAAMVLKAIKSK